MVRDRQHGPVIELNRIQVKRRWFVFLSLDGSQCNTRIREQVSTRSLSSF